MKLHFFSKNKVVYENINDHQMVECPICNREIKPFWEPRYNGIRATCNVCGINWQESQVNDLMNERYDGTHCSLDCWCKKKKNTK